MVKLLAQCLARESVCSSIPICVSSFIHPTTYGHMYALRPLGARSCSRGPAVNLIDEHRCSHRAYSLVSGDSPVKHLCQMLISATERTACS